MLSPNHQTKAQPVVLGPRAIASHADEAMSDPNQGPGLTWKTLISASKTPTEGLSSGIAICEPGNGRLCIHQHTQIEVYHVIEGEGILEIDGVKYPVEKGSVAYIPSNAEHGIHNSSLTHQLKWLYVFAADDFKEVKYRFVHRREQRNWPGLADVRARL